MQWNKCIDFSYVYAARFSVFCCYSWGTRRAQTYTRDRINKTAEWQKANGISMLIFGQLWNEWVSLHTAQTQTHTLATWTLSKTCTHVSSSIELACCRLTVSGACVCLKFFSRLLCILLWRLLLVRLLAFIFPPHLYSTVVRWFFVVAS